MRVRPWRLLRLLLVGVLLVAGLLIGVRAFYTHVVVVPYTQDRAPEGACRTCAEPQRNRWFTQGRAERLILARRVALDPRPLAEITESGDSPRLLCGRELPHVLLTMPTAQLVGFDIEMAHRFTARLGTPPTPWGARPGRASVGLEFVPLRRRDRPRLQATATRCSTPRPLGLDRADSGGPNGPLRYDHPRLHRTRSSAQRIRDLESDQGPGQDHNRGLRLSELAERHLDTHTASQRRSFVNIRRTDRTLRNRWRGH